MAYSRIYLSHQIQALLSPKTHSPNPLKPPSSIVRFGAKSLSFGFPMGRSKAAVVSATATEMPKKKRYPGESKGFVEEMRFVAMKLHTREQASDGEKDSDHDSAPLSSWDPTVDGYLKFLVDSKLVYHTLDTIIAKPNNCPY